MSETTGTIGIIGAGTMGAGIAQVAAAGGWTVELMDVDEAISRAAIDGVKARFARLVEKGRMTAAEADSASSNLLVATGPECLASSDIVLEAIVEDLDVKTSVLSSLVPALRDDCIIATNTSSLSVTELGTRLGCPGRVVGMHFFNPAPLMKLVEVIAGRETDAAVVDRVAAVAKSWGKQVARAADVPGFIVNHVARPYYLEAFRILEDGYATPTRIDTVMTTRGGFRMGPLALTDLIGQDVNTATTRSVWEQLDRPPLLHPSRLQEQLVADGHLGRKSGRGVYDYSGDTPTEAITIETRPLDLTAVQAESVQVFTDALVDAPGDELDRYILARIVTAIMKQASLAESRGVATKADIDTAMKYGVNYPRGPFEWAATVPADAAETIRDAAESGTSSSVG